MNLKLIIGIIAMVAIAILAIVLVVNFLPLNGGGDT